MATWNEAAWESLGAATLLADTEFARSCVSRLYYAAYSACYGWLEERQAPKQSTSSGDPWYSHERLAGLLEVTAGAASDFGLELLSAASVGTLVEAVGRLQKARVEADYVPSVPFIAADIADLRRDAETVLRLLIGIEGERNDP